MPRPTKTGLEYFSFDVNLDEKWELVEAKYGNEGFAITVKLLQQIYRNGYFWDITEEKLLLFKKRANNVDICLVNDIINDCIRWELFDQTIYKKYTILTSRGIQKRYIEAVRRRAVIELISEYWLLSEEETNNSDAVYVYINPVNDNINSVNVNNNSKNADIGTQRKVKESKGNYIVEIINYLNKKCETKYKTGTGKTISLINARLNEGFTVGDFIKVIDTMYIDWWPDNNMRVYLRPQTLFGTKFESYLNRPEKRVIDFNKGQPAGKSKYMSRKDRTDQVIKDFVEGK